MTNAVRLPNTEEVRLARDIALAVKKRGKVSYIVGGFVRDMLLGHEPKDLDMCATLSPQDVKTLEVPGAHTIPTGEEYGTITFFRDGAEVEVTTTRYEIGAGDYRRDVTVCFTYDNDRGPLLDVQRRDLTVNGLLCDPMTGQVVDYVDGVRDLKRRLVRFIGGPVDRCREDALRLLRAVRFTITKQFSIDTGVFEAAEDPLVNRRVSLLSGERVRDELLKMLAVPDGEDAAWAMTMLLELGVLDIWLPELVALVDVRQNTYHSEDVWGHTLLALANSDDESLEVRVALLFHDLGKAVTREYVGAHYGASFLRHEKRSEEMTRKIARRLRFGHRRSGRSPLHMAKVYHLVRWHMTAFKNGKMSRVLKRTGVQDFGEEMLDLSHAMMRADRLGRAYPDMTPELNAAADLKARVLEHLRKMGAKQIRDLPINGHDVMNLLECGSEPTVGTALNGLLQAVVDGEVPDEDRAAMEAYVLRYRTGRNDR